MALYGLYVLVLGTYRLHDAYRTLEDARRAKAALEYMQGAQTKIMRV